MSLEVGSRLGHYDVTALIGGGGMGQVYQATDTNLDRRVAIKVLPDAFTSDADRLARFEREAKVLASLNHPNIGAIYGLEKSGDTRALVLELVEGPTLADRIAQGPISVDEAVPIAKQIAEALEAAHEQGVIHRDLKPANIKVRDDGTVKVLDFGLAKAMQPSASDPSLSQSPTISLTAAATQMGMVVGTPAYMAPEQAKGLPVDKRADIWAFGAVLFEMLTGKKLFEAGDVSEMLASVLVKDPDISSIGVNVPDHIRSVVRRCLVKDPKKRLRDVGDVRLAMEDTTVGVLPEAVVAVTQPRVWQRPMSILVLTLAAAAVTGLAVWMLVGPVAQAPVVTRASIELPTGVRPSGVGMRVVLSPDGQTLVFSATDAEGQSRLYVRRMGQFEVTAVRNTEGGSRPFLSPDGAWVGFFDGSLKKVPTQGGPAQTLVPVLPGGFRMATWGPDDRIIFGTTSGLWEISAAGGEPRVLTTVDTSVGEAGHVAPHFLPGGFAVIFSNSPGFAAEETLEVLRLDTSERRVLVENAERPQFVASGHIVFGRGDSIRAMPFDAANLDVAGDPVPLVEGVQVLNDATQFAASRDGSLVYLTGSPFGGDARTLVWTDRDGLEEPIPIAARAYAYPRVSPDGSTIALTETQPYDIWSWNVSRQTRRRVTFSDGLDGYATWSPDGRTLLFLSDRGGGQNLFRRPADGTGSVERITDAPNQQQRPHAISRDGRWVVFGERSLETGMDLMRLSLEDPGRPSEVLVQTEFEERNADISPDGNWLAYESNPSEVYQVFIRSFLDTEGGLQQVSTGGGRMPLWSPDGRELFYWGPSGKMMAVQVDVGSSLVLHNPTVVFEGPYFAGNATTIGRTFDISPDAERFLMIKLPTDSSQADDAGAQLRLVENWHQELLEQVPVN